MSIKINKIFRNIGIIAMAFAMFFSTASSCTVFAAYSSPSTVSVSKPGFGMVDLTSGNLHVRQYASTSSAILTSLPNESYIMIVGVEGDFYKVQYNTSGSYGYVSAKYVDFWQSEYYLRVNNISGNLNMRSYASTSASVVAKIPANKYFAHFYDVADWYCGLYGNVVGSVSGDYVTKYAF